MAYPLFIVTLIQYKVLFIHNLIGHDHAHVSVMQITCISNADHMYQ